MRRGCYVTMSGSTWQLVIPLLDKSMTTSCIRNSDHANAYSDNITMKAPLGLVMR